MTSSVRRVVLERGAVTCGSDGSRTSIGSREIDATFARVTGGNWVGAVERVAKCRHGCIGAVGGGDGPGTRAGGVGDVAAGRGRWGTGRSGCSPGRTAYWAARTAWVTSAVVSVPTVVMTCGSALMPVVTFPTSLLEADPRS